MLRKTAPQEPAPPAKIEQIVKAPEGKGHAKIDQSLLNLGPKLVNGAYSDDKVKVRDGWVEVVIELTDDSPDKLEALKKAGVDVVSHAASSKKVRARVKVEDLETVAALDFVKRIAPPAG